MLEQIKIKFNEYFSYLIFLIVFVSIVMFFIVSIIIIAAVVNPGKVDEFEARLLIIWFILSIIGISTVNLITAKKS